MKVTVERDSKEMADIVGKSQSQPKINVKEVAISISKVLEKYGLPPSVIKIDKGE